MGLFDALGSLAVHTLTSPLDVVKDVVTMGGAITDEESAIVKKLRKISDDIDEVSDADSIF